MEQLESNELELQDTKDQLQEIMKPFQQEQIRRQKKSDFLKKCVRSVEKNDFFQLDELLTSKLPQDILQDSHFAGCDSIFSQLRTFADEKIENYRVEFKGALLQLAEEAGLPLKVDIPRFSVLKGIEGKLDFSNRKTVINQVILKSIDPERIISAIVKMKRKLYDNTFEPQKFIDALLQCYKEILKESGQAAVNAVPILQLYNSYVWSLQSKSFFQNMDKGKFKGYSIEQFAVDLWRFFESDVSSAAGGYRIRLNPGRGKSLSLIDQDGEKRQITHASFVKH
ncbi:MAG: hypothetical protein WB791_09730 [Waddliaceae bacterium]